MNLFSITLRLYDYDDQSLEGSEGLPMAVQLVTLLNHDERCLRLMKQVETDAKFNSQQ